MLPNVPFRAVLSAGLIFNLAVGPTTLTAPQAAADVPSITIRAYTRLVVVDVVVTDKSGQPVTGLKAEDFTIEENGKKQKVTVFTPPELANKTAPVPAPPGVLSNHPENVSPAGPPTVLMIDALNSPVKEQAYARAEMLKYAAEQNQSGQSIAVVALTDRLHVLQQFTSDPHVLLTAIKNFRPQEQILQASSPRPESTLPAASGPSAQAPLLTPPAQSQMLTCAERRI